MRVQVPLIVDAESGVNDFLDRDGSRTPVQFHISNDHGKNPIDAQVVQAATKWKRMALQAVRDEARARASSPTCAPCGRTTSSITTTAPTWTSGTGSGSITAADRNLDFLTDVVKRIWKVLKGAEVQVLEPLPQAAHRPLSGPPRGAHLPARRGDPGALSRTCRARQRETMILQEYPAIFIYGIGWPLADGYPHEMRAADYDDWVTETTSRRGGRCTG